MIWPGARISAILMAGFLAASCSSFSIPTEQPDQRALAERKAKAEELTRRGALAAALVQWRILESMSRGDPAIKKKRRAVEEKMARLAERHFVKGQKAAAKRQFKTARREFLATLAIKPSHEGAIEQLRAMELQLVRRNRPRIGTPTPQLDIAETPKKPAPAKKRPVASTKGTQVAKTNDQTAAVQTSESLQQALGLAEKGAYLESIPHFKKHLAAHPQDAEAKRLLATSHREAGITLYNNGELRESVNHLEASANQAPGSDNVVNMALADAKGRLAQAAYEKGIKAFRQDVDQAIAYWEETLRYDPSHRRAKTYLSKAYKIQKTLNSLVQQ